MADLLLDVQGLETCFNTQQGTVHAVNGVSFGLKEGETLGVVGESGCGKSNGLFLAARRPEVEARLVNLGIIVQIATAAA